MLGDSRSRFVDSFNRLKLIAERTKNSSGSIGRALRVVRFAPYSFACLAGGLDNAPKLSGAPISRSANSGYKPLATTQQGAVANHATRPLPTPQRRLPPLLAFLNGPRRAREVCLRLPR